MLSRDGVSINRGSVMLSVTIGSEYAIYSIMISKIKLLENNSNMFDSLVVTLHNLKNIKQCNL